MTDKPHFVVKVTMDDEHACYVHFDRQTHELVAVYEYKKIYVPEMGMMSRRIGTVVALAHSKIGKPFNPEGELK